MRPPMMGDDNEALCLPPSCFFLLLNVDDDNMVVGFMRSYVTFISCTVDKSHHFEIGLDLVPISLPASWHFADSLLAAKLGSSLVFFLQKTLSP